MWSIQRISKRWDRSSPTRTPPSRWRPDADGIYWDYDELAKSYVAQKRYGPNVVLAWWNEKRKQGTDERWEQLDQLMQQSVSG